MGITDKFSQIAGKVQDGVKDTSRSMFSMFLKVLTSFFVALTLSLIGQEMMGYGTLAFVFMMAIVIGLLMKLMAKWTVGSVLLFDLFCVLVALLLRLYLQVAP